MFYIWNPQLWFVDNEQEIHSVYTHTWYPYFLIRYLVCTLVVVNWINKKLYLQICKEKCQKIDWFNKNKNTVFISKIVVKLPIANVFNSVNLHS